jgi:hypothetical protein
MCLPITDVSCFLQPDAHPALPVLLLGFVVDAADADAGSWTAGELAGRKAATRDGLHAKRQDSVLWLTCTAFPYACVARETVLKSQKTLFQA